MPDSIVFLAFCHSAEGELLNSFIGPNKARNGFGYEGETNPLQDRTNVEIIFGNMGGKINNRENESVSEAFARITSNLEHIIDPTFPPDANDQRIYNSPRIIKLVLKEDKDGNGSYETLIYNYEFATDYPYNPNDNTDYPGNLSNCKKESASPGNIQIEIKFSKKMDNNWRDFYVRYDPQGSGGAPPVNFSGNWLTTTFENDSWIGVANIPSGQENKYKGEAIIQVKARDSFQGDVNEELDTNGDGDSDGPDTLHTFLIGTITGITAGLVIDRSGSMDEEDKLPKAREAACYFVDASEAGDEIAISAFDEDPLLVAELTEITQKNPVNNPIKTNLKSAINTLTPGGMTNFGAGLSTAYNELIKSTKNQKTFAILKNDLKMRKKFFIITKCKV